MDVRPYIRRLKWLAVTTAILIPFQNCGKASHNSNLNDEASVQLSSHPSFQELKAAIFDPHCLSCHSGGSPDFTSYETLMAGTSVLPGQPASSPLYMRVADQSMPQGGPALSGEEQLAIYNFIADQNGGLIGALPLLSALAVSTSQVNLNWSDQYSNESGFKIERAMNSNGPFTLIQTTAANATAYSDTSLMAFTTYYYRVYGFNSSETGSSSNIVTVTTLAPAPTPPAPPSILMASAISSTAINLSWTDNASNEAGFNIERSSGGGAYSQIATIGANMAQYQDTGLSASTAYSYRVRAYNSAGDSTYSNGASATTQAPPAVTFTSLNNSIFVPKCLGCHQGAGAKGGYDMSTYAEVITRVVMGNASSSLLYTETASGSMPKGSPLSATEVDNIKTWINSGAPNN